MFWAKKIAILPCLQYALDSNKVVDLEGGTVGDWAWSTLVMLTPPLHHEPLHDLYRDNKGLKNKPWFAYECNNNTVVKNSILSVE